MIFAIHSSYIVSNFPCVKSNTDMYMATSRKRFKIFMYQINILETMGQNLNQTFKYKLKITITRFLHRPFIHANQICFILSKGHFNLMKVLMGFKSKHDVQISMCPCSLYVM